MLSCFTNIKQHLKQINKIIITCVLFFKITKRVVFESHQENHNDFELQVDFI